MVRTTVLAFKSDRRGIVSLKRFSIVLLLLVPAFFLSGYFIAGPEIICSETGGVCPANSEIRSIIACLLLETIYAFSLYTSSKQLKAMGA